MKRKALTLLFAVVFALSVLSATVWAESAGDGKTAVTVTLGDTSITYGETYTPAPTVEATDGTWTYSYSGTGDTTYGSSVDAPTDVGTYTVTATYESKTQTGSGTATLTIHKKELTISGVTAANREYDGTTAVALTGGTLSAAVGDDEIGFTLGSGTVADKNVGTGKAVTTAITLTGAKAANYTLTQPTGITVDITQKPLTVTYTGERLTKVYDGTLAFSYNSGVRLTLDGLVTAEWDAKMGFDAGTYDSKDVGSATQLTIGKNDLFWGGGPMDFSMDNYSYTLPATIPAGITPKPVEVTIAGAASVKYGEPFGHAASAKLLSGDTSTYTVKYNGDEKPTNAGSYDLTVEMSNTNYEPTAKGVTNFSITRIAPPVPTEKTVGVYYNDTATKTLSLADFGINIPGRWEYDSRDDSNDNILTALVPTTTQTSISFALKPGLTEDDEGKTAKFSLIFHPEDNNYAYDVALTLSIEVYGKQPLSDVAVSIDSITYGETLPDPVGTTAATGGSWTYTYKGTQANNNQFGSSTNTVKPTAPGSYTVTATYENATHKGSGSAAFTIAKKQLSFTGLEVLDKVYNGETTVMVTGALSYGDMEARDVLTSPTDPASLSVTYAFADAKVGSNKPIIVTGYANTLCGETAWKYLAPTLTLTGNILMPTDPVFLGYDILYVAVDTIANKMSSYGDAIISLYPTADAIQTALTEEAKKTIPTIGSNIRFYDLQLQFRNDDFEVNDIGIKVPILFPYPAGTGKSTTFTVAHMTDDGVLESPAVTNGEYGVTVTVDSTSPFAIAWRKSSSSGSSGSSTDYNYEFWKTVTEKIKGAGKGETIKADAKSYDQMPWTVMQALRNNAVTLVIDWNGGNPITIPAGQALADEAGRIYYPLSYLAEKYKGAQDANPDTGGAAEIVASDFAEGRDTVVTPAAQGIDVEQAKLESTSLPAAASSVGGSTGVTAAALVAAAALAAGAWFFFRKKKEER